MSWLKDSLFHSPSYLALVLFLAMVVAGVWCDSLFVVLGLAGRGAREPAAMSHAGFSWKDMTWQNFDVIRGGGWPVYLHLRHRGGELHGEHEPEPAHEHS